MLNQLKIIWFAGITIKCLDNFNKNRPRVRIPPENATFIYKCGLLRFFITFLAICLKQVQLYIHTYICTYGFVSKAFVHFRCTLLVDVMVQIEGLSQGDQMSFWGKNRQKCSQKLIHTSYSGTKLPQIRYTYLLL
jgi:hypothetical protein